MLTRVPRSNRAGTCWVEAAHHEQLSTELTVQGLQATTVNVDTRAEEQGEQLLASWTVLHARRLAVDTRLG
jgi:hypothetical protein